MVELKTRALAHQRACSGHGAPSKLVAHFLELFDGFNWAQARRLSVDDGREIQVEDR